MPWHWEAPRIVGDASGRKSPLPRCFDSIAVFLTSARSQPRCPTSPAWTVRSTEPAVGLTRGTTRGSSHDRPVAGAGPSRGQTAAFQWLAANAPSRPHDISGISARTGGRISQHHLPSLFSGCGLKRCCCSGSAINSAESLWPRCCNLTNRMPTSSPVNRSLVNIHGEVADCF